MRHTCRTCEYFQPFEGSAYGACTYDRPTPTLIPDMEPPGLTGSPKQIMRKVMLSVEVYPDRNHCSVWQAAV
jgi:hypothetical protein